MTETTMTTDPRLLLRGTLTWDRSERVTDRYGAFYAAGEERWFNDGLAKSLEGRRVRLRATVLETRESRHIGDFFRGIGPTRPDVGEVVDLGEGILRLAAPSASDCGRQIVLEPLDGRETDWIDPRKLYRLHEQTVEIHVEACS